VRDGDGLRRGLSSSAASSVRARHRAGRLLLHHLGSLEARRAARRVPSRRSAAVVASPVRARRRVTLAIAASMSNVLSGGANGGANEAPSSRAIGPTCPSRSVDFLGGERGIRTHGTLTGTPDFECRPRALKASSFLVRAPPPHVHQRTHARSAQASRLERARELRDDVPAACSRGPREGSAHRALLSAGRDGELTATRRGNQGVTHPGASHAEATHRMRRRDLER
jgi:hypothetical protein